MEVLTVYQASKYCGVSPKTVANWIDEGHIVAFRTVRRTPSDQEGGFRLFFAHKRDADSHGIPTRDRKKILVVDDDKLIVETIVTALEEEPHNYEIISRVRRF